MNSPETFVRLLGSVREHLATAPDAGISSVQVGVSLLDGEHVTVHLCQLQLAGLAAGLLAWADTLTSITATAWRPRDGERVHLTVTGRLVDGLAVEVYGGVPYTEEVFGADLQPGGRHGVSLSVLRGWAR